MYTVTQSISVVTGLLAFPGDTQDVVLPVGQEVPFSCGIVYSINEIPMNVLSGQRNKYFIELVVISFISRAGWWSMHHMDRFHRLI